MVDVKSLRGLWGANTGPKMPHDQKQSRKVVFINLASQGENAIKGWKSKR